MTFKRLARPLFGGLLGLVVSLSSVSTTQAALIVTNGGFSNPVGTPYIISTGDFYTDVQDWYVSNASSLNVVVVNGPLFLPVGKTFIFSDIASDSLYQSLGTRDAGEAGIQFEFDAAERGDNTGNGEPFEQVTFELFYDNSGGSYTPADGTEVNTLALLDTQTILGSTLGFDGISNSFLGPEETLDALSKVFDLTGAPVGSEIYLRIGQGGNDGEPYIANLSSVVIEAVPEPSTYVMSALGLLGLGFYGARQRNRGRRRRA